MSKETFYSGQANAADKLRVASVFLTVDGEANRWGPGTWSVFIRLQGCRIGCHWCDTKYTWPIDKLGEMLTTSEIMDRVKPLGHALEHRKVTITGGEPMEQWGEELRWLLRELLDAGYAVSMETGGCDDFRNLKRDYPAVNVIADYKLSSARTTKGPHQLSFPYLAREDVVKLVATTQDLPEVAGVVARLRMDGCRARMVVSPVWDKQEDLAAFVAEMRKHSFPEMGIHLNLQMHKFIWPHNVRDEEGTV